MPRGYDSNGNRTSGGKSYRKPRQFEFERSSEPFDVSLLQQAFVWETLELVLSEGGALRFGLSQDKGAFGLGVYGMGDTVTKYARSAEEFEKLFAAVYSAFKGSDDV